MSNKEAPHMAIIDMRIEIRDILNTGECSGQIVPHRELKELGLDPNPILTVQGKNRKDCITRLRKKIRDFNDER